MKHLHIIFILYLLFTSLCWSKDVTWYDLVERDGLYYEKSNNVPFTGAIIGKEEGDWLEYSGNGQLYSQRTYKDGKYEGEYFSYYESGQLNWKEKYKKGKIDGESLIYYETGQLWYKTNFKNGKRHGMYLKYNSKGKLIEKNFIKTAI